jgi:hypothetical protein
MFRDLLEKNKTHATSCIIGNNSFPGVTRQGLDAAHPPLPSTEIASELELYIRHFSMLA